MPGRRLLLVLGLAASLHGGCADVLLLDDDIKRDFLAWEFGLFVHFNVATFNDREWANGYEDPASFAPDSLDAGQWADAAVAAGMRYAVLTVKHTGGWCLWDSDVTDHDATAFVNHRGGRGDVVRDFVEAFRARGLKVGLYYLFPGDYDDRHGNALPTGQPSLHGLPPEAAGDPVGFATAQLTELLTRYGPIDLLWIDQARSRTSRRAWNEVRNHVRARQPGLFVLANGSRDVRTTDIHSYEYPLHRDRNPDLAFPPAGNTAPAEVSDTIGPTWFWNTTDDQGRLKPAAEIVSMRRLANARSANYLLNVAPDTTGRLPAAAVARLEEVGRLHRLEAAGGAPR